MTKEQLDSYSEILRIEEISRKIRLNNVIPEGKSRSPSPEPIYNTEGKRVNTREYRYRKKLEEERAQLIERQLAKNPDYVPPADYKKTTKFSDKFFLPTEDPTMNFIGLLIGPRGNTLKRIEAETSCKISIRGKGSFKDGKTREENPLPGADEELHAYVVSDSVENVNKGIKTIKDIVFKAMASPDAHNQLKRLQLRELAALNGTLREEDEAGLQTCSNCGLPGHKRWECPEQKNVTATIVCQICGGYGHLSKDCTQLYNPESLSKARERDHQLSQEYQSLMVELGEPLKQDSNTLNYTIPPIPSTTTAATAATPLSAKSYNSATNTQGNTPPLMIGYESSSSSSLTSSIPSVLPAPPASSGVPSAYTPLPPPPISAQPSLSLMNPQQNIPSNLPEKCLKIMKTLGLKTPPPWYLPPNPPPTHPIPQSIPPYPNNTYNAYPPPPNLNNINTANPPMVYDNSNYRVHPSQPLQLHQGYPPYPPNPHIPRPPFGTNPYPNQPFVPASNQEYCPPFGNYNGNSFGHYSEEFEDLCFTFGIELEEDTSDLLESDLEKLSLDSNATPERAQLKIDIPANRYDLLCFEGISRALAVFLGKEKPAQYTLTQPEKIEKLLVEPSVDVIRPVVVAAILRNVSFDERRYKSFIDLQDKLHANIGRKRSLVSIGTHDLDTVNGPFHYSARTPSSIKFVPLNKDTEYTAEELMQLYESDLHLRRFLHIIRDSPVYPLITDKDDIVLSLPPIINGNHSRISLDTKNVFIEITGTDYTKVHIVLNIMVTMFSMYCDKPFTVEPVEIVKPDGTTEITPNLESKVFETDSDYICKLVGTPIPTNQIIEYLKLMSLEGILGKHKDAPPPEAATNYGAEEIVADLISVVVPPTRADILHQVDIIEDIAIAYGYNKIPRAMAEVPTVAKPTASNKLTSLLRSEVAFAGWTEVLTLSLCSHDESFKFLQRKDNGDEAVVLANPKTFEYQVCRSMLLPGILKTVRENKSHPLPFKLFEISDVVLKYPSDPIRKTRNERRLCALYSSTSAQFEVTSGLLDRVMRSLGIPMVPSAEEKRAGAQGYWLEKAEDLGMYLPGRGARIMIQIPSTSEYFGLGIVKADNNSPYTKLPVGSIGVLHPNVLFNFSLDYPCSVFEINIEPFV
ncbi:hypothetical protein BB560_000505 [Smittium megazygosporum]|uniref:Branchpoint-bridging protein n=1 Tax=Smittium megazygosporum TaxID=133381 RepID=A0A2T9ZK81_9FUNG|nr:hypothetical protein BB560_000505 [Smittium megazygosporum]